MSQLTINQMPDASTVPTEPTRQFYKIGGVLGIWLFFTGVQWALYLFNAAVSPDTVERFNQVWFVVAAVVTLALVFYQRPRIVSLSVLRPRWHDLPVAAIIAYVDVNVSYSLMKPPFDLTLGTPLHMLLVIAVVPIVEELLCRGVVLRSLLESMHVVFAIALSSAVIALFHRNFWTAFIGQTLLSVAYVSMRRSLSTSLICHLLINTVAWMPRLLSVAHWRHIV